MSLYKASHSKDSSEYERPIKTLLLGDEQGHFVFTEIPLGEYVVVWMAEGYTSDYVRVIVQGNNDPDLNLYLVPKVSSNQLR